MATSVAIWRNYAIKIATTIGISQHSLVAIDLTCPLGHANLALADRTREQACPFVTCRKLEVLQVGMEALTELNPQQIEQSVPYWFEQQVEKSPDRVAVKSRYHELTYQALNQAANRVARAVLASRSPEEEPIALLFEDDAPMVVAMLGVLKSGKFYLPLTPALPPARIASVLSDAQPGLVLANSRTLSLARELTDQALNIDELDPGLSDENLGLPITADAKAYVIYTSGSTGQPKGIVCAHRAQLHDVSTFIQSVGVSGDDRLLNLFSFGFSAAWKRNLSSLLGGAALVLYNIKEQGLANLANWMLQEEITVYNSAPTTFRHFASTLTGQEGFPTVRVVCLAGESITRREVDLVRKHFPPTCALVTRFSSSETGGVLHNRIDVTTRIEGSIVPAGYPIPGAQVQIVDERGQAVGMGEVGEIAVTSRYLALGYWHRGALDRDRFRPDPEGGQVGTYHTGDLGRMHPDGSIDHLGRKDQQVKIRGHRVEVAEIELALLDHEAIQEAVVVAGDAPGGDNRLTAYIVPGHEPLPPPSELRNWLRQTLPDYMIPTAFITLGSLPLTQSGKLDRARLPAPGEAQLRTGEASPEPHDEVERRLTGIWKTLFGTPSVGLKDDFFELGGHSLLAARLMGEIERTFGKKLSPSTLLRAPTVEQLAAVIRQYDPAGTWPSLVVMQPQGLRPPFFLVHTSGGNLLEYRELARLLGPAQPVWGLLPKGQNGQEPPDSCIEHMAAHCLRVMRNAQPVGPYYLGGYCIAGYVAFEMARQLEAQGEKVGLLALFDAAAPRRARVGVSVWRPRFISGFVTNAPVWMKDNLPGRYRVVLNRAVIRLRGKARASWRMMRGRSGVTDGQAFLEDFLGDLAGVPATTRQLMAAHSWASRSYQPLAYHGSLTLFRVRALPLTFPCDPELGWGRLTSGGVEVKIVLGHHRSLLQSPHVENLAAQLKATLARPYGLLRSE